MIYERIVYFIAAIIVTLIITAWAAKRNQGRDSLYAAGSKLTSLQNGLATAGDFLSAGAILGVVALFVQSGMDCVLFSVSAIAGLCLALILVAGPLRTLGRYTLGDVIEARLPDPRTRPVIGLCVVVISLMNLMAQLVGAGGLISVIFGLPFNAAVAVVAVLVIIYVTVGGMLAATWVQIIKAVFLIGSVTLLAILCIHAAGSLKGLYDLAIASQRGGHSAFQFGGLKLDLFSSVSLAVGQALGIAGLPHLLIRFFTVPQERAARRSLAIATGLTSAVMGILFVVVAPAAIAFVLHNPAFYDKTGQMTGGGNMTVLHLASAMGGNVLTGLIGAGAFSTILAVVAGLTVAISSAVAHDIFVATRVGRPPSETQEVRVFRVTAVISTIFAALLAILFQKENLTFLITLGAVVAASTTFPILILTLYWKRFTADGAIAAGIVGLTSAVVLIILGPTFWVRILGFPEPIFPSEYPALATVPLTFIVAYLMSRATRQASRRDRHSAATAMPHEASRRLP